MKHYTETIPHELAQKLKAEGMPKIEGKDYFCEPSFAEAFDWLFEQGYRIEIHTRPANSPVVWFAYIADMVSHGVISETKNCDSWRSAAIAAIEEALRLRSEYPDFFNDNLKKE